MSKRKLNFNAWLPALGIIIEVLDYNGDMVGLSYDDFVEYIGDDFYFNGEDDIFPKGYMDDDYKGESDAIMSVLTGEDWIWIEDKNFELLPSTGMWYKDGHVNIREGDTVSDPLSHFEGVVKFNPAAGCYSVYFLDKAVQSFGKGLLQRIKLTGTMYDNPEKLKTKTV